MIATSSVGPKAAGIHSRIHALEEICRSRALTTVETDELNQLIHRQYLRLRLLPGQIALTEAKLLRLRAELALLS